MGQFSTSRIRVYGGVVSEPISTGRPFPFGPTNISTVTVSGTLAAILIKDTLNKGHNTKNFSFKNAFLFSLLKACFLMSLLRISPKREQLFFKIAHPNGSIMFSSNFWHDQLNSEKQFGPISQNANKPRCSCAHIICSTVACSVCAFLYHHNYYLQTHQQAKFIYPSIVKPYTIWYEKT